MAVVSTAAAVDLNKFLGTMQPGSGTMAAGREIVEEPMARAIEEKIYVALGREVDKNKSVLVWALHNSGGKRICIIHVHQQARMIPLLGGKFPASSLKQEQVQAYREIEKQDMHKILDQYLHICLRTGVRAEKLFIEMDSIERGILELVSQHGIKKLVMGGAADKHYPKYKHHKKMMDLKSKKANTVREQAPTDCHIWFICKGYLIHTREGTSVGSETMASSSSMSPSHSPQSGGLNYSRSQSVTHPLTDNVNPSDFARDSLRRVRSADYDGVEERPSSSPFFLNGTEGSSTPGSRPDGELLLDEWVGLRRNPSQVSSLISFSPSRMIDLALVPFSEGSRNGLGSCALSQLNEHLQQSSPPSVLEGSVDETMYDQLEQAMADAANLRREAFEEALRRAKAEKDAIEAIRRVKAAELLYSEEQKHRKEIEETLKKEKEGLVKVKSQCDVTMEELRVASHQQLLLKDKVAESEQVVKELEEKIISAVELLQTYKKERDELEMERDKALKEAEELRRSKAEASSSIHVRQFFTEFSFLDIEEATLNFDPSLKIGEGGYGSIYKGLIRHTQVAIKMLQPSSMQGPSEFQQEVDVLSKMRHPNLVTLIGACPESWTLVYEYLPNGSLEDRLTCLDNSPPLSWQTRIRIAAELCCVLIFLHSSKPHSIVHGDLKPSNILLDKNFVSKLSDFGICRLLSRDGSLSGNTVCCRTDPKGTFVYMDPEFLSTGELSPKSDVYSFGIILLRLLTGRPALGISKEVQHALDTGKLKNLLDPLAGDWPFVQAEQLARLALRCCEMNRRSRPDLETEVWRVLEPMRASCGSSSSFRLGSEEHLQPPSYFMCPIFQEIMQDPHIAADGFTYEAEALRGWLDSGHDTSPMTNLKLDHCNLVPNHALRSAIQEWLQQH